MRFFLKERFRELIIPTSAAIEAKKWQIASALLATTTLSFGFQNCSPMTSQCQDGSCAESPQDKSSLQGTSSLNGGNGSDSGERNIASGNTPYYYSYGGSGNGSNATGSPVGGLTPVDVGTGSGSSGTGTGTTTSPLTFVVQPRDTVVEAPNTLYLSAYAQQGVSTVTYQWYKNGAALTGATNSILEVRNTNSSVAGSYYVVAKSTGGTSLNSSTVQVTVSPARKKCSAGYYTPAVNKFPDLTNAWYDHESVVGRGKWAIELEEALDSYIVEQACECGGAILYQCRNGRYKRLLTSTCVTYCGV